MKITDFPSRVMMVLLSALLGAHPIVYSWLVHTSLWCLLTPATFLLHFYFILLKLNESLKLNLIFFSFHHQFSVTGLSSVLRNWSVLWKCCHHILITSLFLLWVIIEGNDCSLDPEASVTSSLGGSLRCGFFVFMVTQVFAC